MSESSREIQAAPAAVSRRRMLALGALVAAAPLLPRAALAETLERRLAAATAPLPLGRAPVGYVDGSDTLRSLHRLGGPAAVSTPGRLRVVAADSLRRGDASLAGQLLQIRVHGLYPAAAAGSPPQAAQLDVLVAMPDSAPPLRRSLPFHAWSFSASPANASPPVAFVLPVDRRRLPELRWTGVDHRGEPFACQTRFALDDSPGLPRLRRGLYLLALRADAWSAPADLARAVAADPAGRASILIEIDLPEQREAAV
jgi:hypothetical protein